MNNHNEPPSIVLTCECSRRDHMVVIVIGYIFMIVYFA